MSIEPVELFEAQRRSLRALAYRMLGSRAEAEDVVQDCWLRWQQSGGDGEAIQDPPAWWSRVVTRLCLDRLRSARARREQYHGVWLPEPVLDEALGSEPGPEARSEYAQDITMAFMLAQERLTPLERAAFLLHEVFDLDFDEIARRLGRSAAGCRQLASRARRHVQSAHVRVELRHDETAALLQAFGQAVAQGDVDRLAGLLADEALFLSDGGGQVAAVPRPLRGAAVVARVVVGFGRGPEVGAGRWRVVGVNGMPGAVLAGADGRVRQVMAFELGRTPEGRACIRALYVVRNPEKLTRLQA